MALTQKYATSSDRELSYAESLPSGEGSWLWGQVVATSSHVRAKSAVGTRVQ